MSCTVIRWGSLYFSQSKHEGLFLPRIHLRESWKDLKSSEEQTKFFGVCIQLHLQWSLFLKSVWVADSMFEHRVCRVTLLPRPLHPHPAPPPAPRSDALSFIKQNLIWSVKLDCKHTTMFAIMETTRMLASLVCERVRTPLSFYEMGRIIVLYTSAPVRPGKTVPFTRTLQISAVASVIRFYCNATHNGCEGSRE